MKIKETKDTQVNKYDKIFRENMEDILPGIIQHVLKLDIVHSEELPDDVQHTKERKPDLLKKVTDTAGKIYVLHIEYQANTDKNMIFRMAEYAIMLQREYELPVKQYVIYIGMGEPGMAFTIKTEDLWFRYNLLALSTIDYKIFLKSDKPEERILAILANFGKDGSVSAIKNILKEVKAVAGGDFAEGRYYNQLRVLVQLRKLDTQYNEAMESITTFFKEERDLLFIRGEVKGRQEGKQEGITAIALEMKKEGIPLEQIAKFTKLSIAEIEQL